MTITKLIDKTKLPNPSQDQATFDANFLQTLLDLSDFGGEINAERDAMNSAIAAFNSALAGNAYAIPYLVDLTSTADADPGAWKLRFNSGTQNLATVLRLDVIGQDTADYTKSIDSFDASTNAKKGTLRIVKLGDSRKFLTFDVTARSAPTGYRNITVTPVDSSSANPFVNGEQVLLFFQRSGDKGDKGDTGPIYTHPTLYVRDERPSGTYYGNVPAGWNKRVFNTVKANTIAGASVSSNRITVPAGTYDIDIFCSVWGSVGVNRLRLYNVTNLSVLEYGNSEHASNGMGYLSWVSLRIRQLVLASPREFDVEHYIGSNVNAGDLGTPNSIAGVPEVYAEAIFRKIA